MPTVLPIRTTCTTPSLTAVAHLCLREPGDYGDRGELRRALIAYNASGRYADDVLRWIDRYRSEPLDEVLEEPGAARPERSAVPGDPDSSARQ